MLSTIGSAKMDPRIHWLNCVASSHCRKLVKDIPRPSGPVGLEQRSWDRDHFASQGEGLHFEPSGSLLNCELVMNGWVRYLGSSTMEVTTSHVSPFGSLKLSKYSS